MSHHWLVFHVWGQFHRCRLLDLEQQMWRSKRLHCTATLIIDLSAKNYCTLAPGQQRLHKLNLSVMANVHIWCGHESKSFNFNKIKSLAFKQELSEPPVFEFSLLHQGHRWRLPLPGQRKGLLQSHLPRPLGLHSGQWGNPPLGSAYSRSAHSGCFQRIQALTRVLARSWLSSFGAQSKWANCEEGRQEADADKWRAWFTQPPLAHPLLPCALSTTEHPNIKYTVGFVSGIVHIPDVCFLFMECWNNEW